MRFYSRLSIVILVVCIGCYFVPKFAFNFDYTPTSMENVSKAPERYTSILREIEMKADVNFNSVLSNKIPQTSALFDSSLIKTITPDDKDNKNKK